MSSTAVTRVDSGPIVAVAAGGDGGHGGLDGHGGVASRLAALPPKAKLSLAAGLAALVGIVLALTLWSGSGDWRVLYANLSDKDGGAIIAQLSQMNVPYRTDGMGTVSVPAALAPETRLKLASAGLPKGTVSGYEQMDNARFGQTQFQERLTFQRGLEGELIRSITSLAAVANARVHLAMPQQNGFFREQQKPSASVLLTLHAGRVLDRAQVAGIVHLVASSVPELDPKAVSVLDQSGALLSGTGDAGAAGGLDAQQLQYLAQVEQTYARRVVALLEPVVGRDNLRATVAAEIDFSQSEQTSEEFRPNQGEAAKTSVRSQQSSEQSNGAVPTPATGVPGAASNQPPQAASAPLTGASVPLQTAQTGAAAVAPTRRDATTNYEVDKTVRVTRNASGVVKRLNAAVVVNHRSVTDAKGKVTTAALSAAEIDNLTALVQQSIGYDQQRGDSVKVINAPFQVQAVPSSELPLWKQPELVDLVRAAAVPTALAVVALVVLFGLVRPAMKAVKQTPPSRPAIGRTLDTLVADAENLPGAVSLLGPGGSATGNSALPVLEPPRSVQQLDQARQLARDNPQAVANIVRDWVNDAPAA